MFIISYIRNTLLFYLYIPVILKNAKYVPPKPLQLCLTKLLIRPGKYIKIQDYLKQVRDTRTLPASPKTLKLKHRNFVTFELGYARLDLLTVSGSDSQLFPQKLIS